MMDVRKMRLFKLDLAHRRNPGSRSPRSSCSHPRSSHPLQDWFRFSGESCGPGIVIPYVGYDAGIYDRYQLKHEPFVGTDTVRRLLPYTYFIFRHIKTA